jgi:myb proto-oncogene protein
LIRFFKKKKIATRPKSKFSSNEDRNILSLVNIFGRKNWKEIGEFFPQRIIRQVLQRYNFYLDPKIKKTPWNEKEDRILVEGHEQFGNSWNIFLGN